jgi:hypothetical protein
MRSCRLQHGSISNWVALCLATAVVYSQQLRIAHASVAFVLKGATCSCLLLPLCRLKVHYRAPPGGRGSGVERGHGEELPHCPLCLASLDDVKYHKCSAGPAAQASVSGFEMRFRLSSVRFAVETSGHRDSSPTTVCECCQQHHLCAE